MSGHNIDIIEEKQRVIINKIDVPKPGSIWQHYKGDLYLIEGLVMKESTEEIEVCYSNVKRPLPIPWTRPLSEWNELLDHNGVQVRRFVPMN